MQEELGFTDAEWGLLVGLPQSVMLAASSIEADGTRRTATENAAGMTAIAEGRQSSSQLVYAIANRRRTRSCPASRSPICRPSPWSPTRTPRTCSTGPARRWHC